MSAIKFHAPKMEYVILCLLLGCGHFYDKNDPGANPEIVVEADVG